MWFATIWTINVCDSDANSMRKRFESDSKAMLKRCEIGAKAIRKRFESDMKSMRKRWRKRCESESESDSKAMRKRCWRYEDSVKTLREPKREEETSAGGSYLAGVVPRILCALVSANQIRPRENTIVYCVETSCQFDSRKVVIYYMVLFLDWETCLIDGELFAAALMSRFLVERHETSILWINKWPSDDVLL